MKVPTEHILNSFILEFRMLLTEIMLELRGRGHSYQHKIPQLNANSPLLSLAMGEARN